MNTVVMVTLVGSTMVGSAQFKNMESCMFARDAVHSQDDVSASCVYRYKKPKDRKGEQIFAAMLNAMAAVAATTKCGTLTEDTDPK